VSIKTIDTSTDGYERLRPLSYPQTGMCLYYDLLVDVFLLLFSVVNPYSFYNVFEKWIPEVRHHMPRTPIILCGTKIDLRQDRGVIEKLHAKGKSYITKEEGEWMAEQSTCIGYVENSALTGENVAETFQAVINCAGAANVDQKEFSENVVTKKKKHGCISQ
jgi:GTPase SAR1 family protein